MQKDYAKNRAVAEVLYRHTLQAVDESGLPVVKVTGAQQRGPDFGTRLANAFADAFAQGYDHVIAVGNDCPRLHEVEWSAVVNQLEGGTPVLGPTPDRQGTYLIGLRRDQFHRVAFAELPWQSPALLAALVRHLADRSEAAPTFLPARHDVNGPQELLALFQAAAPGVRWLVAWLRCLLGEGGTDVRVRIAIVALRCRGRRLRAPPLQAQRHRS